MSDVTERHVELPCPKERNTRERLVTTDHVAGCGTPLLKRGAPVLDACALTSAWVGKTGNVAGRVDIFSRTQSRINQYTTILANSPALEDFLRGTPASTNEDHVRLDPLAISERD